MSFDRVISLKFILSHLQTDVRALELFFNCFILKYFIVTCCSKGTRKWQSIRFIFDYMGQAGVYINVLVVVSTFMKFSDYYFVSPPPMVD